LIHDGSWRTRTEHGDCGPYHCAERSEQKKHMHTLCRRGCYPSGIRHLRRLGSPRTTSCSMPHNAPIQRRWI
jgi:hypothetical protein